MRSLRTYGAVMTQTESEGSLAHSSFPSIYTHHNRKKTEMTAEMLWLYVTVSCVLFGSSAGVEHEEVCYGRSVTMPFSYIPLFFKGQLYFTPKNGGSSKLLMDNGKAKHPRLKVSTASVKFTQLTERDEGTFSISHDDNTRHEIVKLKILDCAEKITRYYGAKFSYDISRVAEFLEFIPLNSVDQLKVLWNRTDPQTNKGGRGRVRGNVWEIINLSQADMGHYNFRAKDNTLVSRILLTVKEKRRSYHTKVNERLFIENPSADALWTVIFKPEGEGEHKTLMKAGRLVIEDDWNSESWTITGRIEVVHDGFEIDPVESTDAGIFEYRDPQGHLAQTVEVEVTHDVTDQISIFAYVAGVFGMVVVGIFCCCCCLRKSSSKRDESAPQTAAAPAVYYHDFNQPTGPSSSAAPAPDYSYQPMNIVDSREPTATSLEPSVYSPVNIHVNSPQPEVAPPGGQGANPPPSLGSDFLSSDPEPKFELKGLHSAPPLSSDSTFCDVYTSDKLNYL